MPICAGDMDSAGLGLAHARLELVEVRPEWVVLGRQVAAEVAASLAPHAVAVEHIGSTSVEGLLAKPVLDVAIGAPGGAAIHPISAVLASLGWIHRGDAGDFGGHVFVLESRAGHRVAHAHVVDHDGTQWSRYLALRDALHASADARRRYSDEKRMLLASLGRDNSRGAYTDGKTSVIEELIRNSVGS